MKLFPCAGLPRVPVHILVLGIGLCVALYTYYMYGELQRVDARLAHAHARLDSYEAKLTNVHNTLEGRFPQQVEAPGACAMQSHPAPLDATAMMLDDMMPTVVFCTQDPRASEQRPSATVVQVVEEDGPAAVEHADPAPIEDEDDEDEDEAQVQRMLMLEIDDVEAHTEADGSPADDAQPGDAADSKVSDPSSSGDPRAMRVDDLRRTLREKGLDSKGTKDQLVARLLQSA